jgi:photosystem II stability/assembly factor-like uncharacterized protein
MVWVPGDVVMADAMHGWMPNACPTSDCYGPELLTTADGGATWQSLAVPSNFARTMHSGAEYSLVTAGIGFVVVSGEFQALPTFFKTDDGGRTFTAFTPRLTG